MKSRLLALIALPLALQAAAAERIVSIGGDVTQIIYALDAQQELVARDSTSLHPAVAKKLPDVGYMRQLNAEGILALKPTLVIASELAKPALALKQVEQNGVKVVDVTGKADISAISEKIHTIATALHREDAGKALQEKVRKQLSSVPKSPLPVKVLFILAHQGMGTMGAGSETSADAAIHAAGLQNAMASVQRYKPLSQEGVIASAPQLIVATSDGIRTLGGEENLWKIPGLALTPAGKNQQLLIVDDMALLGFGIDTPAAILKLRQTAEALP
ncbi:heme/hemin ABC transporter substrate-binding protein [Erwinia sorbitola]|uniref:ABC transporter substrate-binding protein n=1 Tax=Erwinia sorbitola TaxID=2681984 RepID=A0A6I6EQK3_9GAMM|nr:hemin ABC transporter substrate-binding protein [Erwinia sorbitola]MTD26103.1 ABC transporter substrate-binding protein [Erwinia sorbitola]QGU87359.1 ABC transporter substrate-binding protein [Erwinia sorbitola]